MPDNNATPLSLPPGVSDGDAEATIKRWAPLIRLHRFERHLPSIPDDFQLRARFRESRSGKDRGWDKAHRAWIDGDHHGPEFLAAGWNDIVRESGAYIARHDPQKVKEDSNARPRDGKNVRKEGSADGLFLERARELTRDSSGLPVTPPHQITAPVYVDTYYDESAKMVRVLYWFFYDLNHWHFMITHEGDWEHVTMVYREENFAKGLAPRWVYFAQHNQGEILQYVELDRYDRTHRVVYVDKAGHPCHARIDRKSDYIYEWKTWDVDMHFIPRAPWRDFAGAWGEVGETKHTTGPLGPAFKRVDNIRVRKIGLKSYVVMKQK